jgi:hypothetical protein
LRPMCRNTPKRPLSNKISERYAFFDVQRCNGNTVDSTERCRILQTNWKASKGGSLDVAAIRN